MKISGLNKLTLLDYPEHTACTVFTAGCNFRCPFCQNASLVLHPQTQPVISEDEIFAYLKKRVGILEGVAITGGEPTLNDDLPEFIAKIRALGFDVKLDSNGARPEMIKTLVDKKLVNYFAMDVKNCKERYSETAGVKVDLEKIDRSIKLIMNSGVDYEFRTTVCPELHSVEDIRKIGEWIKGAKRYFLQGYRDSGDIIDARFSSPSASLMQDYKNALCGNIGEVTVRGE